jgi:phosphopantetheinyl transferase
VASAIHCRYRTLSDLPTDRQAAADWLSPLEHAAWLAMRSTVRQTTWLAGRVVAKQLTAACLSERSDRRAITSPTEIHIESRSPTQRLGARPTVLVSGRKLNWGLSIAHSRRGVLVAVAVDANVGVDLVASDECRAESLGWCFSSGERRWLATLPTHGRGAERLWAMKEAVFKACHAGEGFAPQRIEIVPAAEQMSSSSPAVRQLQCWRVDAHVAALAVADRPVDFQDHYPSSC